MPTIVDPYRVVNLTIAELARAGHDGPYTTAQFAEAATLAAALLAALGTSPAVSGDTGHPHARHGLALLEELRAGARHYRTGQCAVCGTEIEYVVDGPDPYWWRHTGASGGQPHPAWPRKRDGGRQ